MVLSPSLSPSSVTESDLGTTGLPKGVLREAGGHAVGLNLSIRYLFGIRGPGDVMFCASDIGWVVGHSYILYAPLLAGAATVLFEGKPVGTPNAGSFWYVIPFHSFPAQFPDTNGNERAENHAKTSRISRVADSSVGFLLPKTQSQIVPDHSAVNNMTYVITWC